MTTITRQSLSKACYHADGRTALLESVVPPGGLPVTRASVELARAAGIPDRDVHWCLCYAVKIPDRVLWEHACAMVRATLEDDRRAGREPHFDTWRAVDMTERHVRGEATDEEIRAASIAASRAISSAAYRAAYRAADIAADLAAVDDLVARIEELQ